MCRPCSAHTRSGRGIVALVIASLLLSFSVALASSEGQYEKAARVLNPVDVVSEAQLQQARRNEPARPLQISGVIQGLLATGDKRVIILELVDKSTAEIECKTDRPEIKTGSRVRCLAKPADNSGRSALFLVDLTWDKTPLDVLAQAARAALKIPVTNKDELADAATAAAALTRAGAPLPSRGGDKSPIIRQAIAYLNPRLSSRDVSVIADSILSYCAKYGLTGQYDAELVVAVIAAESRFNPNARSYKGAAGLGQLMPSTAAAHGVDPYDPVANLEVAVRIIRMNLDRFGGDWNKALAAYNAGAGAVTRHGGVPPYRETRNYLWKIYEYWCWLTGQQPVARPK
jgi:hypothetical protein